MVDPAPFVEATKPGRKTFTDKFGGADYIKAIDAGRLSEANRGMAQVAKILGIIGSVLLVLGLLWVLFFGGMAFLGALTGGHGM